MTVAELVGCLLITFGPPLSMFVLTVAKDPLKIILMMASAFFWLMSLLFASFFWFIKKPGTKAEQWLYILVLMLSVIFQELFRFLFYFILHIISNGKANHKPKCKKSSPYHHPFGDADEGSTLSLMEYRKARVGLEAVSNRKRERIPLHMVPLYYVSGLGYGVVSGAFATVNLYKTLSGPGTIGIQGDSEYYFIITAFTALAFVLLHTFWGVVFMASLSSHVKWRMYLGPVFVLAGHLLASGITLLNYKDAGSTPNYAASLTVPWVLVVIYAFAAWDYVGGRGRSFNHYVKPPLIAQIRSENQDT